MKLVALCSPLEGEYATPILRECRIALRWLADRWRTVKSGAAESPAPPVAFPEVKLEGDVKFMKTKVTHTRQHLHSESSVTVGSYDARMLFSSCDIFLCYVFQNC